MRINFRKSFSFKGVNCVVEFYEKIISALMSYFDEKNWQKLFMSGGCYWLAEVLHGGIPNSYYMINRIEEHCALYFNKGLYDVRGKISCKNFVYAQEKDISYMKKNYIPKFDTHSLEQYLIKSNLLKTFTNLF